MFLDQALSLYICAIEMGVLSSKSTVIDSLLKLMTESSMKQAAGSATLTLYSISCISCKADILQLRDVPKLQTNYLILTEQCRADPVKVT